MKASQLKALIGKRIYWDDLLDRHRGTFVVRTAIIKDVHGRNIETEDSMYWAPDLLNLRTEKRSPLS